MTPTASPSAGHLQQLFWSLGRAQAAPSELLPLQLWSCNTWLPGSSAPVPWEFFCSVYHSLWILMDWWPTTITPIWVFYPSSCCSRCKLSVSFRHLCLSEILGFYRWQASWKIVCYYGNVAAEIEAFPCPHPPWRDDRFWGQGTRQSWNLGANLQWPTCVHSRWSLSAAPFERSKRTTHHSPASLERVLCMFFVITNYYRCRMFLMFLQQRICTNGTKPDSTPFLADFPLTSGASGGRAGFRSSSTTVAPAISPIFFWRWNTFKDSILWLIKIAMQNGPFIDDLW